VNKKITEQFESQYTLYLPPYEVSAGSQMFPM